MASTIDRLSILDVPIEEGCFRLVDGDVCPNAAEYELAIEYDEHATGYVWLCPEHCLDVLREK